MQQVAARVFGSTVKDDASTINTILRPAQENKSIVFILGAHPVLLEGLRMTGATGAVAGSVFSLGSTVTFANSTITRNETTRDLTPALDINQGQVTLINTRVTGNTGTDIGGVSVNGAGRLILDTFSRVTGNTATRQGVGGIDLLSGTADLPSVANVTGNTPVNCSGVGFTGPGAVCTTN